MSCPRFFLASQKICDHTTCSRHAVLVCLHAALIGQIGIPSAPIEPSRPSKVCRFQQCILTLVKNALSIRARCQPSFSIAAPPQSPAASF